jgi:restriction system protein
MARKNESILNLLFESPWWVSVVFSAFIFVLLRFVIPTIGLQNPILRAFSGASAPMAPFIAFVFLLPAPISALKALQKRKLLDSRKDLGSVRMLSWRKFEELVGEAYRRQGYKVIENSFPGPDGGVDLTLKKNGDTQLVQCKHWRTKKVGVKIVREIYGVMTARNATGAIVITSGSFTQEAKDFAAGKPIELVNGEHLAIMIRDVQSDAPERSEQKTTKAEDKIICPKCGAEMVQRIAKRGKYEGQKFWGCTKFPACKMILDFKS